ncbi:MAG: N-acetylmuramoyl-L-alanine amidase [Actinomycetota bacterium]
MKPSTLARLAAVVLTLTATLVPALAAPTRSISVPETLHGRAHALRGETTKLGFPATHIGFRWSGGEGSGVRYRTIDAAGARSRWRRATEAHDLEHGAWHYSAVLSVGRPTAVQWERVGAPGAYVVGTVTLDYLNTVDGPRRTVEVPALAEAATRTPDIVTRAEWGADESIKRTSGSCRRRFYPVQQLFVHHTAGSNFETKPKATMRAIYYFHTVTRGWCDVGYNFVIGPDGTIFEGRWARSYGPWETHTSESRSGNAVAGAHVAGYNSGSVGVSMMGNFSNVELPPPARRSLAELLAWEADRHGLKPTGTHTYRNPESGQTRRLPYIAGHRDAGSTDCPGGILYAQLPDVRRDAAAVMGAGKSSTGLTLSASELKPSYGETVTLTGMLTGEGGLPMAARPITLYGRGPDKVWFAAATATTGHDGSFSVVVGPQVNTRYVAFFSGDDAMWGSQSDLVRIKVKPEVTIAAEGGTVDPFTGASHHPSGTATVYLSGTVTPDHRGDPIVVAVFERALDGTLELVVKHKMRLGTGSTYRYGFPVPEPRSDQTFQAETRFVPDDDHAWSVSPRITFTIDP